MDAVQVIPMNEKTKKTREIVTMNRVIPVACFLFLAFAISSCDQSTSNKSTQTSQQSSSTSTVNTSKSDENMVPLVTEEEKRRAEEQHKEATTTDLLKNGPKNDKKIKLY